jgi:hypothetical protein
LSRVAGTINGLGSLVDHPCRRRCWSGAIEVAGTSLVVGLLPVGAGLT